MHLAEVLDPVRAEGDEPGTARARLHALHAVVGGRVAPQQVHEHDAALLHRQRPLQRVDLLYAVDAAPDACPKPTSWSAPDSHELFKMTPGSVTRVIWVSAAHAKAAMTALRCSGSGLQGIVQPGQG